jgi:transcriptional regulator GlxA family with amidase domain
MAYLTGWRLRLAAQALTSTPKGVADIAAEVGYESEAALSSFQACIRNAAGPVPAPKPESSERGRDDAPRSGAKQSRSEA